MAVRADHRWQTHMAAAERRACSHWAEADSHGPDVPQGGRDLQREPAHDADLPHLVRPHCKMPTRAVFGLDPPHPCRLLATIDGDLVRTGAWRQHDAACCGWKTDPA